MTVAHRPRLDPPEFVIGNLVTRRAAGDELNLVAKILGFPDDRGFKLSVRHVARGAAVDLDGLGRLPPPAAGLQPEDGRGDRRGAPTSGLPIEALGDLGGRLDLTDVQFVAIM